MITDLADALQEWLRGNRTAVPSALRANPDLVHAMRVEIRRLTDKSGLRILAEHDAGSRTRHRALVAMLATLE